MAQRSFPTTRWSVVAGAQAHDSESKSALEALCNAYWEPVHVYIMRRGASPEEAKDLAQDFFARVLERHFFDRARQERGSFRGFLLSALKFFLADQAVRKAAQKRGTHVVHVPVGEENSTYQKETADWETPDRIYERRWALTLIERLMDSLAAGYQQPGKQREFELCKQFLVGDDPAFSYDKIAAELGMSTGALKVAVHRMRKKRQPTTAPLTSRQRERPRKEYRR